MITYSLKVSLQPSYCNTSCPPPPAPPVPSPENHIESFRCSCLVKYHEARLAGLDHVPAIREASRLLKLAGHPWHYVDLVAHEINHALGRRPGRRRASSKSES